MNYDDIVRSETNFAQTIISKEDYDAVSKSRTNKYYDAKDRADFRYVSTPVISPNWYFAYPGAETSIGNLHGMHVAGQFIPLKKGQVAREIKWIDDEKFVVELHSSGEISYHKVMIKRSGEALKAHEEKVAKLEEKKEQLENGFIPATFRAEQVKYTDYQKEVIENPDVFGCGTRLKKVEHPTVAGLDIPGEDRIRKILELQYESGREHSLSKITELEFDDGVLYVDVESPSGGVCADPGIHAVVGAVVSQFPEVQSSIIKLYGRLPECWGEADYTFQQCNGYFGPTSLLEFLSQKEVKSLLERARVLGLYESEISPSKYIFSDQTPDDWATYENSEFGFRLSYPKEFGDVIFGENREGTFSNNPKGMHMGEEFDSISFHINSHTDAQKLAESLDIDRVPEMGIDEELARKSVNKTNPGGYIWGIEIGAGDAYRNHHREFGGYYIFNLDHPDYPTITFRLGPSEHDLRTVLETFQHIAIK